MKVAKTYKDFSKIKRKPRDDKKRLRWNRVIP